jgi:hypothetical protein
MSRNNQVTIKYTTTPKDYTHFKVKSLEIGSQIVDVSHKPSFEKVLIMIINKLLRSEVEEFLREYTGKACVDLTDRNGILDYDETTGLYFQRCSNPRKISFLKKLFSFIRTPLKIKFRHDNGNINMFCMNC